MYLYSRYIYSYFVRFWGIFNKIILSDSERSFKDNRICILSFLMLPLNSIHLDTDPNATYLDARDKKCFIVLSLLFLIS